MRKIIGIILLLASGGLGYLAYNEYQEHNKVANAVEAGMKDWNESMKDTPFTVNAKVKKEVPTNTILAGAGAVVCLLAGAGLIVTGK